MSEIRTTLGGRLERKMSSTRLRFHKYRKVHEDLGRG